MTDVACPQCGTRTELPAIRRSADEFCPHCDYPLFWVRSAVPATVPGGNAEAALRRLPGAGGRQRIGSVVCPACGELNPLGETHCLRCLDELDPKPVLAPEPVVIAPVDLPAPEPVMIAEPRQPAAWWLVAAGVAMVLTVFLLEWRF